MLCAERQIGLCVCTYNANTIYIMRNTTHALTYAYKLKYTLGFTLKEVYKLFFDYWEFGYTTLLPYCCLLYSMEEGIFRHSHRDFFTLGTESNHLATTQKTYQPPRTLYQLAKPPRTPSNAHSNIVAKLNIF